MDANMTSTARIPVDAPAARVTVRNGEVDASATSDSEAALASGGGQMTSQQVEMEMMIMAGNDAALSP